MAEGEIFAGEAVLLGAEDDRDGSGGVEFAIDDGRELVDADDGLLRLAMSERAGPKNQGGVADGVSKGDSFAGTGE